MKNMRVLFVLLLLLTLLRSLQAASFVSAKVSFNEGAGQSYDLVNEPVKIYSAHGMFEYPMDSIRRLWRSEPGPTVCVETIAGDKITGSLITENLPYLFFDEKKWIEMKEDVVFSIELGENESRDLPGDRLVIQLADGSVLVCQGSVKNVETEVEGTEYEMPLASVSDFHRLSEEGDEESVGKEAYRFSYVGNGSIEGKPVRRFDKLAVKDFFGHRLELPIDSIINIKSVLYRPFEGCCPSGTSDNTVNLELNDGRTETADMPFFFFDFTDNSRNVFRIPSFYITRIESQDGEVVIYTIFDDCIVGRSVNKVYHLLLPGRDDDDNNQVEVSVDSVASVVFPKRVSPQVVSPVEIRLGKVRICGDIISMAPVSIPDENKEMQDFSLPDAAATLLNKEDTWYVYCEKYPAGVEAGIDARSLEFASFCDGVRHTFRWRDIDRVLFAGGYPVPGDEEGTAGEENVITKDQANLHENIRGQNPRMRAGHVLQIHVLVSGETEIEEPERRITSSGDVSLPLLGSVKVESLTLDELEKHLTERYREYLREPQVVVQYVMNEEDAAASPWGAVTVLGTVKEPGKVNIPPTQDLTVSMAIQQAGGFDKSANDKAIKVTRMDGSETTQFEVNLRNVGARGATGEDMRLQPGDVVYVPEMIF